MQIERLSPAHDQCRKVFDCGKEPLNRYLRERAGQDFKAKVAVTFVLVSDSGERILGYYTLSALSVRACELPVEIQRKLPRYPEIPVTLMGRLAIDKEYQGQGFGEHLLLDALRRSLEATTDVASFAVLVDAKDENACQFYRNYDFIQFPEQARRLFLPMRTIEQLLR